jgi:hypothetical protein
MNEELKEAFPEHTEAIELYEKIMKHGHDNKYNYKIMCEHISKADLFTEKLTADQIFQYSPTGELFNLTFWYAEACEKIGLPDGKKIEDL